MKKFQTILFSACVAMLMTSCTQIVEFYNSLMSGEVSSETLVEEALNVVEQAVETEYTLDEVMDMANEAYDAAVEVYDAAAEVVEGYEAFEQADESVVEEYGDEYEAVMDEYGDEYEAAVEELESYF